jgi:hypothetical protein
MTDQERLQWLEHLLQRTSRATTIYPEEREAMQITIDELRHKLRPDGWPTGEKEEVKGE